MIELYSIKETARLFGVQPSALRYWTQKGFVAPTVRKNGRHFYTFRDLISVKAAKAMLDAGMSIDSARPGIETLRANLPKNASPKSALRVCSDGETVAVIADEEPFNATTRDVVVAFKLTALASQIAETLKRESPAEGSGPADLAAPVPVVANECTEPHKQPSAYECFRHGFAAENDGQLDVAEQWYRRALELESSFAAAQTNLGNVMFRRGHNGEARVCYERALEHEPDQPEARFNLGNILDELGETELAIAELRQVVSRRPDFADAHYNLGLILARVGGVAQAKQHLDSYLALDKNSDWAHRARGYLAELAH